MNENGQEEFVGGATNGNDTSFDEFYSQDELANTGNLSQVVGLGLNADDESLASLIWVGDDASRGSSRGVEVILRSPDFSVSNTFSSFEQITPIAARGGGDVVTAVANVQRSSAVNHSGSVVDLTADTADLHGGESSDRMYCDVCGFNVKRENHALRCEVKAQPKPWVEMAAWLGDSYLASHLKAALLSSGRGIDSQEFQRITSNLHLSWVYGKVPPTLVSPDFSTTGSSAKKRATMVEAAYAFSHSYRRSLLSFLLRDFCPQYFFDRSLVSATTKIIKKNSETITPGSEVHGYCYMKLFNDESLAELAARTLGSFPLFSDVRKFSKRQVNVSTWYFFSDENFFHVDNFPHPGFWRFHGNPSNIRFIPEGARIGGKIENLTTLVVSLVPHDSWSSTLKTKISELRDILLELRDGSREPWYMVCGAKPFREFQSFAAPPGDGVDQSRNKTLNNAIAAVESMRIIARVATVRYVASSTPFALTRDIHEDQYYSDDSFMYSSSDDDTYLGQQ